MQDVVMVPAEDPFRSWVSPNEVCGQKCFTGQAFLRVLEFRLLV